MRSTRFNSHSSAVIGASRRSARNCLLAATALAILPGSAWAAEDDAAEAERNDETIVVTGTLVRGVAPTGSNVIGVSAENVLATGAATTAQLLQTVPQLGSFNDLQFPTGFGNSVTANRPNLRNLPGFNTAGGSSTLVLLDGHRMVGVGITSTAPDPDVIPAGAIERLEVVPDGGSAMYGSDAVAGVLNFVTRKKFDGFQISGRVGFADNYTQYTADATVGRDWGSRFLQGFLGASPIYEADRPHIGGRAIGLAIADVTVELQTPTGPGLLADHHCRYGDGVRSVLFGVRDIEAARSHLASRGLPVIDGSLPGAITIPAEANLGILFEFME